MTTGIILTYASGVDLVVEWKIGNFFNLPETDGTRYHSPFFSFGSERWYLWIFPNDSSGTDSSGHVDLYLGKCSSDRSIKQSFSLSLKTAKGEKYNEQHRMIDFKNYGGVHHVKRFIRRLELCRRKSDLTPDGTLTVICTMKSSTAAGSDREEGPTADINMSAVAGSSKSEASGSSQTGTTTTKEAGEEVPTADVNMSAVAGSSKSEASGSSQAGTTNTKELVLKWIKENCEVASKGKKRKTEKENVLKWIEENFKETSEGKKRKLGEKNAVGKSLQDLKGIMVNGDHSDVTVSVRGEEFRLHRSILGVRNPIFGMRFNSESQETTAGTLFIENCDPEQFRTLVHYIYTGTADNLCPENVCGLYDVAVAYQEQQMRAECLQLLMNTLSVDNFCDYTSLALKHDLEELLQKANELFLRKVKEITRHEKWEAFLEKYPAQANKLYMKALEQYDTK